MELSVQIETWPIRGTFAISRGQKTEAKVLVVTIRDGEHAGRGECVPYVRYRETLESVHAQVESVRTSIENSMTRTELQRLLPAGAARNALDCALWDLEAKKVGKSIWELIGLQPKPMLTAYTISLDTPKKMAENAGVASKEFSLLKIKIGEADDKKRLEEIRKAAPRARLIIDANEGWSASNFEEMVRMCESVGVELIEQPLPAGNDDVLSTIKTAVKICADESAHTAADITNLIGRYNAVNIKLDKAGGLTEALAMATAAKEAGVSVMVGCMVSTSLSMAPGTVVAQFAEYVDLDGPLLLEKDRQPAIEYKNGMILPTTPALWG